MNSTKSAFWNVVFALFFGGLVLSGVDHLLTKNLFYRGVGIGDFLLMALAIFRLVRLVSYDIIFRFVRDALATGKPGSFVGTMSALVSCPWCIGLWFSFFVVFFYYATPYAWPIILILALAGVASVFQVFSNLIGWHAEGKKRDVLGSANPTGSTSTCG
ncbi:MAG: DUF1360 domain-containing protein [Minisyncoccia bacterium]